MSKAIVIIGPPASGKSYSIEGVLESNKSSQVVSIDKDVLNNSFFIPKLRRGTAEHPNPEWNLLWKTTEALVKSIANEHKYDLKVNNSDENLIVILQGASLGGVMHDIHQLVKRGFEIEFRFLTVENVGILKERITARASKPNFIGADDMSVKDLSDAMHTCSTILMDVVKGLRGRGYTGSDKDRRLFSQILCQYSASIRYLVKIDFIGLDADHSIKEEIFSEYDIDLEGEELIFDNGVRVYKIAV